MENEVVAPKKKGAIMVFLASLLWAGDTPFRQPLIKGGLFTAFIGFLEHLFNTLASSPDLWRQRSQFKKITLRQFLGLLYIGVGASAIGTLLYVNGAVAMNYNFNIALLLQKLQPVFAIILAVIFLKEKFNPKFWFFVPPALLGAYFVTFGIAAPSAIWQSGGKFPLFGPALAIGAAALWAGGTVVGRSLLKDLEPKFVNAMRFLMGFLFLAVYVAATKSYQFNLMTPIFWRNVVIIALLTGFFALLIYYQGLKNTKASVATLMELGYPLAAVVINWIFLKNTLDIWQIAGAVLLLISVTLLVLYTNKYEN